MKLFEKTLIACVIFCAGTMAGMLISTRLDQPIINFYKHEYAQCQSRLHLANDRVRELEEFVHLKPKRLLTPKILSHTGQWSSGNVVLYSGTYGNMVQTPSILDYAMPLRGEDSIFFHNLEDSLNMLRLYRWSHRIVRRH